MSADIGLIAFAMEYAVTLEAARALLDELRAQAGAERFYIYWTAGGGAGGASASERKRTLLAVPTPDAALAFAQRNGLGSSGEQPRSTRRAISCQSTNDATTLAITCESPSPESCSTRHA